MKNLQLVLLSFILLIGFNKVLGQTWSNPITLPEEWELNGSGDPYLLKYNGYYYLYCSTRDDKTGVKCWRSKGLVDWDYQGLVTTESITKCAYAPEVIYYEGNFYMYTSPGGNGHYVLKADAPTGPFILQTGNLGQSIDGSVFIEDDGSLYFYRADHNGIIAHPMNSPTQIGEGVQTDAYMNGWTEAPCVVKRNGVYYMQYTGNHVLARAYRIDYAHSKTGPMGPYVPYADQNPFIVNTEGDFYALGHGSMFIGPDLDTYYVTYHNKEGDYGYGPYRHINFDQVAWNGDDIFVLGATNFAKPIPKMPDFFDYFDTPEINSDWMVMNGGWSVNSENELTQNNLELTDEDLIIINHTTDRTYTAEFNVRNINTAGEGSYYGVVYDYIDDANYSKAVFQPSSNVLIINIKQNGVWQTTQSINLTGVAQYKKWHAIRIEKRVDKIRFFIDNMKKAEVPIQSDGGKLGLISYQSEAAFGYCALTNKVDSRSTFDAYKPIPGILQAIHYNSDGMNAGYHEMNLLTEDNFRGDSAQITAVGDSYALGHVVSGNWYKYKINVGYSSDYLVGINYASEEECELRFSYEGELIGDEVVLPSTGGLNNYQTSVSFPFYFDQGLHSIKVEVVSGSLFLKQFEFDRWENTESFGEGFDTDYSAWNYVDGGWTISNKEASINATGKITAGSTMWNNYTVEVDVKYIKGMNAGLLFRVKNPGQGGIGNDPEAGGDFLQGYYFTLSQNGCVLGKQNFNWSTLATASGSYQMDQWYHIKATVEGSNFKIYVGDMSNPVIDYTDVKPFVSGKVGLRAYNCHAKFDNFMVYDTHESSSIILDGNYYALIADHSDMALSKSENGSSDLVQNVLGSVSGQEYLAMYYEGYWALQNYHDKTLVAPVNGNNQEGTSIALSQPVNQPYVFWDFKMVEDGLYNISNKESDLSLAVENSSVTSGSNVVLQTYTGEDHQKWKLKLLSESDLSTVILKEDESNKLRITPNPVENHFKIEADFTVQKIAIYDVSGVLVNQLNVNNSSQFDVNSESLSAGTYWVCVSGMNKTSTSKIVVQ